MRVPGHGHRRSSLEGESMTPMIDVVFLLLVFFVCASIGQKPDALMPARLTDGNTDTKVELPPQQAPEWKAPDIVVRLTRIDGHLQIELNSQEVPGAAELHQKLKRLADLDPDSRTILDVGDDVSVQQFIAIYDLCQSLGFQSIAFSVRNPG